MSETVTKNQLIDSALKYQINSLIENHKVWMVEFILEYLDVSILPSSTIVVITNAVKHHTEKLSNYKYWYEKCMSEFQNRGHDTSKLLTKD